MDATCADAILSGLLTTQPKPRPSLQRALTWYYFRFRFYRLLWKVRAQIAYYSILHEVQVFTAYWLPH